ncbi:MAG: T9SS type A sorting domain-containing protein [Chitinophagaceae bacterium]
MKKIIIIGLLFSGIQLNAQLYINNSAEIKLASGGLLTINEMDLVNNGTFNQTTGTVRFIGNTNTSISGTQTPVFNILEMAKGTNNRLLLQRTINVGNQINFVTGYLDLNGNIILLQPTAFLNAEDETSRITGTTGGYVEITNTLNAPTNANPGNLGTTITSAANLGSTIIRRGHQSQSNGTSGNSVNRYFDILPTNNTALNATLNVKYFDAELNGLTESSLSLWKSADNISWTNQGFDQRSAVTNYVEKNSIADFSRWTLSTLGNALPVQFLLFNVKCNGNTTIINWKTATEINSSHFEVQRISNAINWTSIGTVPAAGNSSTERSYTYTDNNPLVSSFYRIAEYDIDGRTQYTSIIKNNCGQADNMQLWPNPVTTILFANINVADPSAATISVYDSKGALVKQLQNALLSGSNQVPIDMSRFTNGMYQVVASWNNGKQQKSFKIMKQ